VAEENQKTGNKSNADVLVILIVGLVLGGSVGYYFGQKLATTSNTAETERLRTELSAARAVKPAPDPGMLVPAWARQVHWHWQIALASKDDAESKFTVTTSMFRPDHHSATEIGLDASDNEAAFDRSARAVLNDWLAKHAGCRFEEPVPGRAVIAAFSHDGAELATTFATTVVCPSGEMTDILRDPFSVVRTDLDRMLRNPQDILHETAKLEKETETRAAEVVSQPTNSGNAP